MGRQKVSESCVIAPQIIPAMTDEEREDQMIFLATNLAEQQLRNGTASSQVITHYLKLGSSKEKLEKELLATQIGLASAKTEAYQESKEIKALYEEAVSAFKIYSGETQNDQNIF